MNEPHLKQTMWFFLLYRQNSENVYRQKDKIGVIYLSAFHRKCLDIERGSAVC